MCMEMTVGEFIVGALGIAFAIIVIIACSH
jgi:hypothetical protein